MLGRLREREFWKEEKKKTRLRTEEAKESEN